MEYYLRELREETDEKIVERHAGGKARADVAHILDELGVRSLDLQAQVNERKKAKGLKKVKWHFVFASRLKALLKELNGGDTLYLQFPLLGHSVLHGVLLKYYRKDIKIVLIIHDLTILRELKNVTNLFSKIRLWLEEKIVLLCSSNIIVHNAKMASYMEKMGVISDRLINLQIFDYIVPKRPDNNEILSEARNEIIIAGNLEREKAGYVYDLPSFFKYNLYGLNYDGIEREYVNYLGSYKGDELPYVIRGRFGLVWDGASIESCVGSYGEYLRINNPHKTSLYLAAGIPVAIWEKAALADFIRENKCGILINSFQDLQAKIEEMSEESYMQLQRNARQIGEKIREGSFLKSAIKKSRKCINIERN